MMRLGRRAFLIAAALLRPDAAVRTFAQPAPSDLDVFLAVSRRLTGETRLPSAPARLYLDALLAAGRKRRLLHDLSSVDTTAGLTPAHAALEEEIVTAWFTGTYDDDGQRRVATHADALMWRALGRPAPGICASARASWSNPPAPDR